MDSGQDHEVVYLSTYLLDRGQDQVLGSCGEHLCPYCVYAEDAHPASLVVQLARTSLPLPLDLVV